MHGVSKVLFRKTSSVPAQWVIWVKSTRSAGTPVVSDSDHTVSTRSTSTPMVLDSDHTVSTKSTGTPMVLDSDHTVFNQLW